MHSDPHEEDIFLMRGNARLKLKDYAGAVADYTKSIEVNPNSECFGSPARTNLDIALKLIRESEKK